MAYKKYDPASVSVDFGFIDRALADDSNEIIHGGEEDHALYLSSSSVGGLKQIGDLLSCARQEGEDDESFRKRLLQTLRGRTSREEPVFAGGLKVEEPIEEEKYTYKRKSLLNWKPE